MVSYYIKSSSWLLSRAITVRAKARPKMSQPVMQPTGNQLLPGFAQCYNDDIDPPYLCLLGQQDLTLLGWKKQLLVPKKVCLASPAIGQPTFIGHNKAGARVLNRVETAHLSLFICLSGWSGLNEIKKDSRKIQTAVAAQIFVGIFPFP